MNAFAPSWLGTRSGPEIVVRVLRANRGAKMSSGQHRLAVNRFNNTELIRADLDQRNLRTTFSKGNLIKLKARF